MSTTWAIVVAGGDGARLGADRPKAFVKLGGRPLLAHSIDLLEDHPAVDRIVLVVGRIDLRGRELQIRANDVREPDLGASGRSPGSLIVDLPASACTPAVLSRLKELFETHAGASPVRVRFLSSTGVQPLDVGSYRVDASGTLMAELRGLLGGEAARVEQELIGTPR